MTLGQHQVDGIEPGRRSRRGLRDQSQRLRSFVAHSEHPLLQPNQHIAIQQATATYQQEQAYSRQSRKTRPIDPTFRRDCREGRIKEKKMLWEPKKTDNHCGASGALRSGNGVFLPTQATKTKTVYVRNIDRKVLAIYE